MNESIYSHTNLYEKKVIKMDIKIARSYFLFFETLQRIKDVLNLLTGKQKKVF